METIRINHYQTADMLSVLELQMQNHKNVLLEDKQGAGFVSLLTPPSYFKEPGFICIVAKQGVSEVIGYIIAVPLYQDLPNIILHALKKEIGDIKGLRHSDTAIIAQVCVSQKYRSKGVASLLYKQMEFELKNRKFRSMVTEVSTSNPVSQKVHEKIGFVSCKTYNVGDNQEFMIIKKDL